mgnify:CR=1 FL=1
MDYFIGCISGIIGALLAVYLGALLYYKAGKNEFPVISLPKPKHKVVRAKRDEELDE